METDRRVILEKNGEYYRGLDGDDKAKNSRNKLIEYIKEATK